MITIGVQTKGILPDVSIAKGIGLIKSAGFDCIDFNLDSFLTNTSLYQGERNKFFDASEEELIEYFSMYRKEMDKVGIRASQMHAPYPIWVDLRWEQNDYMLQNVIPKSILIASVLGIPWVVVHPAKMQFAYGKETEIQMNIEFFKGWIPLLKKYKVGLCVENLYEGVGGRIIDGPCSKPEEATRYVDTLNELAGEELFGLCLDTGHLQITKRPMEDYIRRVGNRIKILHIHENDGISDGHQMPFTFGYEERDGLDWEAFAKSLREIGFDGTLNFETHPCMRSFPEELLPSALKTIYGVGQYLKDEIEG